MASPAGNHGVWVGWRDGLSMPPRCNRKLTVVLSVSVVTVSVTSERPPSANTRLCFFRRLWRPRDAYQILFTQTIHVVAMPDAISKINTLPCTCSCPAQCVCVWCFDNVWPHSFNFKRFLRKWEGTSGSGGGYDCRKIQNFIFSGKCFLLVIPHYMEKLFNGKGIGISSTPPKTVCNRL